MEVVHDIFGWFPTTRHIHVVRSIFWLICISSFASLLTMVLLLPETLHVIVGEGSIVPSVIYRPVIPAGVKWVRKPALLLPPPKPPSNLLRLMNVDILMLLVLNAIVWTIYSAFITSLSTLFTTAYPFLNSTTLGLCYLEIGEGMMTGSWVNRWYLDREYVRLERVRSLEMVLAFRLSRCGMLEFV